MRKNNYPVSKVAVALLLTILASACTADSAMDSGTPLPEGKYPVEFTSQMYGMEVTRATSGNKWDGDEKIALKIESDVKQYVADNQGNITADAGVIPFYWTSTGETKTVSAYYPFALAEANEISVKEDQSNATNYQASDALYTPATLIAFTASEKKLTFNHLPAKVVANLNAGDGVTEIEVQGATVKFVSQPLSAPFNNATGTVTAATPGSSSVSSNKLATPESGFQQSVQALLVPCQMKDNKFIEVAIGNDKFYYTPTSDTDGLLESGKVCTYEITVKRDGIEVVLKESGAWENGGNEDVQSRSLKMQFRIDLTSYPSDKTYILPFKTSSTSSTGSYTLVVNWGDGATETIDPNTPLSPAISHTYADAKEYPITISTTEEDFSKEQVPGFKPGNYRATTNNNKLKLKSLLTPLLNTGEADFTSCFNGCKNLTGSIPENLFINNPQVTSFKNCFRGCSSLTGSIPEKLFTNNPLVTSFFYCFKDCSGLTGSIPENLFVNNPLVEDFNNCFAECAGLTGAIPEGLFAHNPEVTTFYYVFYNCSELTLIPSKLFEKNTKAENFECAFGDCFSLPSIPSGLFDNNLEATTFLSCFCLTQPSFTSDMSGLIPAQLFAKNLKATNFKQCFQGQTKLLLNSDIFCEETAENKANRFAKQTVNFSYCFDRVGSDSSVSGAAGTAPELWNGYAGTFTSTKCFENIGPVTNAGDIPSDWQQ